MKYIIGQSDIDWAKNRWYYKGYGWQGYPYKTRKGYISLYDRNSMKFAWFKILEICADKYAYIVERRGLPTYWKNQIKSLDGKII